MRPSKLGFTVIVATVSIWTFLILTGCGATVPGDGAVDPIIAGLVDGGYVDPVDDPNQGDGGADPNDDTPGDPDYLTKLIEFTVEPVSGPRPLIVASSAATIGNSDSLPGGQYSWGFDGVVEGGPLPEYAQRSHVFRKGGLHTVTLTISLAGLTAPISCVYKGGDSTKAIILVDPRISGQVLGSDGRGVVGVVVTATNAGGATGVTDDNGLYELDVPYNWSGSVTPQHNQYSFDPSSWAYYNVTVDTAEKGFVVVDQPASVVLSGYVDTDSADPIPGVSVTASNAGGSVTTGQNGYYELTVSVDWSGTITPSHDDYDFEPSHYAYPLAELSYPKAKGGAKNINFRGHRRYHRISGLVRDANGNGISAVNLDASNNGPSATTNQKGQYHLDVSPQWTGTITPSHADRSFNPAERRYPVVITTDTPNQDFVVKPIISGQVRADGNGVAYVDLIASNNGGSATTDQNGQYQLAVPPQWSGTVTPSHKDYTFSPAERPYPEVTADTPNQDFVVKPIISGQVLADGNGVEGVKLIASNYGGSATTDQNGQYQFAVIPHWSGTVTPSHADYTFSPAELPYPEVTTDTPNQVFTATPVVGPGPAISGICTDGGKNGLLEVTLTASTGESTTSDPNGFYLLRVTESWSGTITPSLAGYIFEPNQWTDSNITSDVTGVDFEATSIAPGALVAPFSNQAVTVDGTLDVNEWADAQTYTMDGSDTVPPGVMVEGRTVGASDTSATIYLKHDATYLYIAVDMTDDDVIQTAANVWEADDVELFLDHDNSDTADVGFNRMQFTVNAGGQTSAGGSVPPGSWTGASSPTGNGYSVEFRITKADYGLTTGTYGFDIAISDVEPTAGMFETRYWYFATSEASTDESQWGDVRLDTGAPVAPIISSIADHPTEPGVAYSQTPTLAQGSPPITWSLVTGPAGMAINSGTGAVTWADPQPAGSPHAVKIRATNSVGSDEEEWQLSVTSVAPVIASIADHSAAAGVAYTRTPTLTQGSAPITWSLVTGPSGIAINASTGEVTWADPQSIGDTHPVRIRATNATGNDEEDWTLSVTDASGEAVIVASRTEGIAPLAIFFEGTQSRDASGNFIGDSNGGQGLFGNDLVEYTWKILRDTDGDGIGDELEYTFSGFNAAYVFEPPGSPGTNGEPSGAGGTYTVTLTVRDKDGQDATTTQQITVQPFSGMTYYVRADGSDSNTGTGPADTQAWQTYSKAFSAISNNSIVQPGDRVLFRRGHKFLYTNSVSLGTAHDVIIGAYEDAGGSKPLIQYAGSVNAANPAIESYKHAGEIVVMDIDFNCESDAPGNPLSFFVDSWMTNLLLLRANATSYYNFVAYIHGLFIVDCELTDSHKSNLYLHGKRLALVDSYLRHGPRGNGRHNIYGSVVDRAVIKGNYFEDSTWAGVRIAGNNSPGSWNVLVSDNEFNNVVSPLDLKVTNGLGNPYTGHNILAERNYIHDCGYGLRVQRNGYIDVLFRNNLMVNVSYGLELNTIHGSGPLRGIEGLKFYNNTMVVNSDEGAIRITTSDHRNVRIFNNIIQLMSSSAGARAINIAVGINEVVADFNLFHLPNQGSDPATFRVGGTDYTLTQWRANFGQGENSLIKDPAFSSGFELLSGSPAINSGQTLVEVYEDCASPPVRRPVGAYDVGAFEFERK